MKFLVDRNQLLKHVKDLGTKEGPKTRLDEVIRFTVMSPRRLLMSLVNTFKGTMRSVVVPTTIQTVGTLMVQRSQFQSALELAEPGEVCIHAEGGNLSIGADVKLQLHEVEMDDYSFDLHTPSAPLVLPIAAFRAMVADVKHAVCKDGTRYNLNHVYFHDEGGGAIAVATDGHRLARTGRWMVSVPTGGVMFPDAMLPLLSLVKDGEATVTSGYWSPPPPPVEYEEVYKFRQIGMEHDTTFLKGAFEKHRDYMERDRTRKVTQYHEYKEKGKDADADRYQVEAEKIGKYLEYLYEVKPTEREKKFDLPRWFVVQCGDYHFTMMHNKGEFPEYQKAFPQGDATFSFRANAGDLRALLARLPFPKKLDGVCLAFTATECSVSRTCVDTGITFTKSIPVTADVFPKEASMLSTRLNLRYILDILKVVGRELVITTTETPCPGEVQNLRPVKFLDGDREERLFVVMPMQL